ncbi:hypothetical protein KI387_023140 [Taxus chinensis]|uniref:Peroxidase n=1 Tax=Taxus chinensis TaxID=29808 RepID=A0AA38G4B4_TAXCH|nr:hypothetical protein KI387_023140 [Taxus chinensis]
MKFSGLIACIIIVLVIFCSTRANGQLSPTFYAKSCPRALSIVQAAVAKAVNSEKRMGASLLRLHYHDCFVNGCDGSILLDDNSTFTGEKGGIGNVNSMRGFDVVDTIKKNLEAVCSGVVSCADILAIAARDSIVALKGPSWKVQLGRRDSTTASLIGANTKLPSPFGNLSAFTFTFRDQGLSATDMVTLSGAHSIGQARCIAFRPRIYNDTNIDSSFANATRVKCPSSGGDANLSPLDVLTPITFDNKYYKNLVAKKGLLHSDQALFNGGSSDVLVKKYSNNEEVFFSDFAAAMIRMGNITPLTGKNGEVRKDCRKSN